MRQTYTETTQLYTETTWYNQKCIEIDEQIEKSKNIERTYNAIAAGVNDATKHTNEYLLELMKDYASKEDFEVECKKLYDIGKQVVKILTDRQLLIFINFFILKKQQNEIAEELNISCPAIFKHLQLISKKIAKKIDISILK